MKQRKVEQKRRELKQKLEQRFVEYVPDSSSEEELAIYPRRNGAPHLLDAVDDLIRDFKHLHTVRRYTSDERPLLASEVVSKLPVDESKRYATQGRDAQQNGMRKFALAYAIGSSDMQRVQTKKQEIATMETTKRALEVEKRTLRVERELLKRDQFIQRAKTEHAEELQKKNDEIAALRAHLECGICTEERQMAVASPCGHCFCVHCLEALTHCALCHKPILVRTRLYYA